MAEDPVYFTDRYAGRDQVLVADVAYVAHPCGVQSRSRDATYHRLALD